MKRVNWEVCVILKVPDPARGNVELVGCKDKRTAVRVAGQIRDRRYKIDYDYEAIFVQANNGEELLDDLEICIA